MNERVCRVLLPSHVSECDRPVAGLESREEEVVTGSEACARRAVTIGKRAAKLRAGVSHKGEVAVVGKEVISRLRNEEKEVKREVVEPAFREIEHECRAAAVELKAIEERLSSESPQVAIANSCVQGAGERTQAIATVVESLAEEHLKRCGRMAAWIDENIPTK